MEKQILEILKTHTFFSGANGYYMLNQADMNIIVEQIIKLPKNTPQTIEKNKNVLKDLFNECKNVQEFIEVISQNFELK